MKRSAVGLDAVADWANLRLAVANALRGKRDKADARAYTARLDENLADLRRRLLAGTVAVGDFRQFTIHDPKERLITAPCFAERVLHHAVMNACEPVFERWLIHDTYACRRGKGRVACLSRARAFSRRHAFFLKLDVRKYFDSIDHATLEDRLARRFKDAGLLALFGRIIDAYAVAPGKGLPIGSLTSQHFANFYLGWCDRFAKERLRLPGYTRYMDDMVGWADDAETLRGAEAAIGAFLADELHLTVKPHPYTNRTRHGLDFLGCRVYPTHLTLNARSRRRFARNVRAIDRARREGGDESDAQRRAQAVFAFATAAGVKSWRFRRRTLQQLPDDGRGHEAGPPGRELEQQRQELPLRVPQQERPREPEPELRVPPGRSSDGGRTSPQEPAARPAPPHGGQTDGSRSGR